MEGYCHHFVWLVVLVLTPHLVPADGDFVFWLIKIVPTCRHISGVEQYSNTLTGWNWSHIGGVVRKLAMFVDSCLEVCEEPALDNLNSLTVSSLSWKGRIIRPGCRRTCHPHHRRLPSWAAPPGTCPGLTHSGCFPLTKFSSSLPTLPGLTEATAQWEESVRPPAGTVPTLWSTHISGLNRPRFILYSIFYIERVMPT